MYADTNPGRPEGLKIWEATPGNYSTQTDHQSKNPESFLKASAVLKKFSEAPTNCHSLQKWNGWISKAHQKATVNLMAAHIFSHSSFWENNGFFTTFKSCPTVSHLQVCGEGGFENPLSSFLEDK